MVTKPFVLSIHATYAVLLRVRCKMAESVVTPSDRETNSVGKRRFLSLDSRTGKSSKSARTPWLFRRHTPYVKTPKTGRTFRIQTGDARSNIRIRNVNSGTLRNPVASPKVFKEIIPANSRNAQYSQCKDAFEGVIGKTLRVYQASPLYKFDTSNVKKYTEQLSAFLHVETEKQMLFGPDGEINERQFKADVSVYRDISDDDTKFSAVKITVENLTPGSSTIFTSILCSAGREVKEDVKLQNHFVSLPICLMKGPVEIVRNVISWFEQNFDCRISPITFSSTDLGWYFSLWAGISYPGKSSPIELCYEASNVNGLSRILFSIEQEDAQQLWENIHDGNSPIFTEEESVAFLKALKSHFYHHFRINLEGLPVSRVRTAIAYLATEGKLKIVQANFVLHIVEQLTRAALTKEFYERF